MILLVYVIVAYLITGVIMYFDDFYKRAGKGASLIRAVQKVGLKHVLYILWISVPGYALFWGLGEKLREKYSDWLFTKIS